MLERNREYIYLSESARFVFRILDFIGESALIAIKDPFFRKNIILRKVPLQNLRENFSKGRLKLHLKVRVNGS